MAAVTDATESPKAKSSGLTESERYLASVCERNFLSLWSYPRPFRDQAGGKEICDLLVVMGNDVIVFSDKHCVLDTTAPIEVAWGRWFRSAVAEGARQAWGGARWLQAQPTRVFLDPECTQPLYAPLPPADVARYHLVVTVHGIAAACKAIFGGSGSLMMRTDVQGLRSHHEPFVIGDLDTSRPFVHVFDDATLDLVMSSLDTATDFLRYLRAKEALLRSRTVFATGEEDLLACYLTRIDETGEHAFVFDDDDDVIVLDESWWSDFESSVERQSRMQHDKISYLWDEIIGRFAIHALDGTQYFRSENELSSTERVLRFMAAEPRLHRRGLAQTLLQAIRVTPADQRRLRVAPPRENSADPMYVFLLFPWLRNESEEDNRRARIHFLEAAMYVAKLKCPGATDIVGFATESGSSSEHRSEDAMYFDARQWNAEYEELARTYQRDLEILVAPRTFAQSVWEYPESGPTSKSPPMPKVPRNSPCPCGSGKKFKVCHGR